MTRYKISENNGILTAIDIIYNITYTNIKPNDDKIDINDCRIILDGSRLILTDNKTELSSYLHIYDSRVTATYVLCQINNKTCTSDIINGEEFEDIYKFVLAFYYLHQIPKDIFKNKINFLVTYGMKQAMIVLFVVNYVLTFLNIFLCYFSYSHNADIIIVNIIKDVQTILKIYYRVYELKDQYTHYVMRVRYPGILMTEYPKNMTWERIKKKYKKTFIYTNVGFKTTYYGIIKTRGYVDNYFIK